jgi:hypothetical protein
MSRLIIEYVLDGYRRGYNFTSPTQGIAAELLAQVWRMAMPRGQGWAVPLYRDAVALKCFPVSEQQVALSIVSVTDLADENGRRGIRRALIDLYTVDACRDQLQERLEAYPEAIRRYVEKKPGFWQRHQILERAQSNSRDSQAILARPYVDTGDWQYVEAIIVKLALGGGKRSPIVPFTTLALDHRDETRLVGIPAQQLSQTHEGLYFRVT